MPKALRAATAREAVEGLSAVEESEAAAEATPVADLEGHKGPEAWDAIAYLGLCQRTGSAIRIRLLEATAALESDGSIEIQGRGDYTPPPEEGIAAEFGAPWAGTYACTIRLSRRGAMVGLYEFAIDNAVLGNLGIDSPTPANYTFVVRLGQGAHAFRVRSHGVSFSFYSLTVHHVPELAPA